MRTDFEVLAVRGESLAVSRWTSVSDAGDTSVHLALNEVDEDGRIVRSELFETGDPARVVALLDEWYLEGDGAEHAWMIRPSMEFWRSYNARGLDGVRRLQADRLRTVDHRLASAGSMIQTADQFLTYAREMVTLVPDVTAFDAEYLAIGLVWTLSRHTALGTSTQGADVEFAAVMLADTRDGRFTHSEIFAPEQLAEALARFEQPEAEERDASG